MISIVKFGSEGWRPAASKVRQHTDQTLTDPLSGPWATRQLHRPDPEPDQTLTDPLSGPWATRQLHRPGSVRPPVRPLGDPTGLIDQLDQLLPCPHGDPTPRRQNT